MEVPQVKIRLLDEVNAVVVNLPPDHISLLYNHFGVHAPNYFFHPKYKLGVWDGKIRFFTKTGKTYVYLLEEVLRKLVKLGHKPVIEDLRTSEFVSPNTIDHHFMSHVLHLDKREPIELEQHQVDGINALISNGHGLVIAGTGAGKAQPLYSKILTPQGWKTMGEMSVGDIVVTPLGNTSTVVGVFPQGKKDIYEITFHDGSKTKACKEHLWEMRVPKQLHKAWTETKVVQTSDIIDFLNRKGGDLHTPGNMSIPLCNPVPLPPQHFEIDPYVLGVLIGDGSLTTSTPMLSNKNVQLLHRVSTYVQTLELKLTFVEGSSCDYRISKQQPQNTYPPTSNILTERLKDLSLSGKKAAHKFIPEKYKRGSIEQRWEILRGLFDTDGTADERGMTSFTTVSEQLAHDVQEVVWSLGGTCTITSRIPTYTYKDIKKQGQRAYTCFVRCKTPSSLFYVDEKKNRCHELHGDGRIELTRRVVSVEYVGQEEAQCILIDDPKHLYITDDYIVTHNTLMCTALCMIYGAYGLRTITIVPNKPLINKTKAEYKNAGLEVGEYSGLVKDYDQQHIVSTWQALKNNPGIVAQFQVVIVDECHGVQGNVLSKLLTDYCSKIPHRFGFTGTLPKEQANLMAVNVALGYTQYEKPAHELIEEGWLARLDIDIIELEEDLVEEYEKYKQESIEFNSEGHIVTLEQFKEDFLPDFGAEVAYLRKNKKRIKWIANKIEQLRDQRKGNVMVYLDSIPFARKIAKEIPGSILVNGKDMEDVKEREKVYAMFAEHDNLVVIATRKMAGTGLDIHRIFNIVFVDPGKSFIRAIQAIGRGLRRADDKDYLLVTDICSDLYYSKEHQQKRRKYYKEAKYPHKVRKIQYTKPTAVDF